MPKGDFTSRGGGYHLILGMEFFYILVTGINKQANSEKMCLAFFFFCEIKTLYLVLKMFLIGL